MGGFGFGDAGFLMSAWGIGVKNATVLRHITCELVVGFFFVILYSNFINIKPKVKIGGLI